MFGREMNTFENYQDALEDDLSIQKRAKEIKELIENDQPKSADIIHTKQEKQKQIQNKQHNIQTKQLEIGTMVFVKSMQFVKPKLEPIYHGPYKIDGMTKKGNYWVKNARGTRMRETYPLSRLKISQWHSNRSRT